jgi:hypothetical protein
MASNGYCAKASKKINHEEHEGRMKKKDGGF